MSARPQLPKLAWRNIWRNRRRTLITLFSIAFGTLLAVLMTGLGDSTYSKMINHAARLGGGHVLVQHPGYRELPSLKKTVRADAATLAAIDAEPEVRAHVPRITGGVMLATSANSVGAMVIGLDPAVEDETTFGLRDSITAGQMFETAADEGIILGKTLAENLDVELGKKVVYTVTDKSGQISEGLARVSGIIETGATEVDAGTCLLPLDTLRKQLGYAPDEVTMIAVFLDDHRGSEALARRLGEALADNHEHSAVLPWFEAQPDLAGYVAMEETGTLVFEVIVTILVAAGIFNTIFVSVLERMRELGILAAIGFSSAQLFALVMWESFWLGVCGIVAGVVLTAWPYYYFATTGLDVAALMGTEAEGGMAVTGVTMDPILYVDLYPPHGVFIAAAVVLATMVAGLYPAYRAGRLSPVEVIRIV